MSCSSTRCFTGWDAAQSSIQAWSTPTGVRISRCSAPGGERFYLEARVVRSGWTAVSARIHELYETLRQLESPDFFIWVKLRQAQETLPSGRRIVDYVGTMLRSIDYDTTMEEYKTGGFAALPRWPFEREGWRKQSNIGQGGRSEPWSIENVVIQSR